MFSPADATVIVAVIAMITAVLSAVIASRNRQAIQRIDRAVNHQPDDAPTLIQRVVRLEENQEVHAVWTQTVLEAVAHEVGVAIPPRPLRVLEPRAA